MPAQRWEVILILLAVVLQLVYQHFYDSLPKQTPDMVLSALGKARRLLEGLSSMSPRGPESSTQARPVYHMPHDIVFDGSSKCANHHDGSSIHLPMADSPYTIEAWVMPENARSNESLGIVGWGDPVPNRLNGLIFFRGADSVRNVWWQNDLQAFSKMSLADGNFHHVAASWDGSVQTIAVDFEIIASRVATGYAPISKRSFCVGRAWHQDGTYANFKGRIKDLKIWNISRTVFDMHRDANLSKASIHSFRKTYQVHTQHGFLNIHTEAGNPFRTDNVVGRWHDGDTFEAMGDMLETQHGPWVQSARGWSIAKYDNFEFLRHVKQPTQNELEAFELDDSDGHVSGMWYHGIYEPCLRDAYNGMFHHDWGQQKGKLFGRYPFGPLSRGGCYDVEEWHPGGIEACAFYLTHVPVEVIVAGVRVMLFSVDQSNKGGRWNRFGQVDLSVASMGEIRTSNNGTATGCQARIENAGECFWIADAFRLRRVADSCADL